MSEPKPSEGFDDLDFDLSKVVPDPKGDSLKTDLDPEPTPEPTPEPKRGRPKKVEPTPAPVVDPEPEPEPEPEPTDDPEPIESSLFKTLAESLGIELGEEDEYEETEEGLAKFVSTTADKLADSKLNGWLESLPSVASDFFDYLQMLGEEANEDNVKKFFTSVNPEIDFKSIDLTNEDAQKAVMRTFYKKMDYTDEEIKEALDDLEIGGTLAKSAKIASAKLAAKQDLERNELIEKQKAADLEKREKIKRYWDSVGSTIKSGKVGNFNIPTTEQQGVLEYMSKPTKSGVPQLQEDLNAMSVEDRIQLAIAVKNKFNLSKYISAAVKTAQASTLKDRLAKGGVKLKGGAQATTLSDDIEFTIK